MADTVIKRVGGKIKLREWIKKHLPPHNIYAEPFSGSFAVGLSLPRASQNYRKVFNDSDQNLYNFFKTIRDHKQELLDLLVFTPYSRKDYEVCHESIMDGSAKTLNPIEWARRYLVYNRQSFAGKEDGTWSIARSGENIADTWAHVHAAINDLSSGLSGCFIECEDYREIFRRWDSENTLFYIDPPYEKVEGDYYKVNKKDGFDHVALAKEISSLRGSAAVSYYDSQFIRDLYTDFQVHSIEVTKHMETGDKKGRGKEILLVRNNSQSEDIL